MQIRSIRHLWPEDAQFRLTRTSGAQDAILLHFVTPVYMEMAGLQEEIAPGALVLFAPGEPHAFCARGPLVHNWMHLSPDAVARAAEFGLKANVLYYPQNSAEITACVETLEIETRTRAPYWEQCVDARLVELFVLIARGIRQKSPAFRMDAQSLERLKRLRMEMIANVNEPWSIAEMAARINASPSWLFSAYRPVAIAFLPGWNGRRFCWRRDVPLRKPRSAWAIPTYTILSASLSRRWGKRRESMLRGTRTRFERR